MVDTIHIWPEKPDSDLDSVICSATLELPGGVREKLWYKNPSEWKNSLTEKADPYLIATIFSAMAIKADIHVHGIVSKTLLENMEEFQAVWHSWKPESYQPVSLFAEHEIEAHPPADGKAIISFSGGVDSCFSVYRHAQKLCGRQNKNIKAGVMIHGFDIPLKQAEIYALATVRSTKFLNDVGIPLIPVSTNWREMGNTRGVSWEDSHATAMISVISLFQNNFLYGLVASGDIAYKKIIWGSNPLSDPKLSSEDFKIIPDGASFTRVEKVSQIADWEAANQNLRVFWEGPDLSKNCGVCEKCIRTTLDYRVVSDKLPAWFDKDISNEQTFSIPIHAKKIAGNYQSILDHAFKRGLRNDSWVRALEK
ncbi:MAG: hypothetical protein ABSG01_12545 [Anaerolineales bacterium]